MKKVYSLLILLLTLTVRALAQQQEITGTVRGSVSQQVLADVQINLLNGSSGSVTDSKGRYCIAANLGDTLIFTLVGYQSERRVVDQLELDVVLKQNQAVREEIVVRSQGNAALLARPDATPHAMLHRFPYPRTGESYGDIQENRFLSPLKEPLSTFAVDVDAASYSNIRRMINAGEIPPKDAVRVEEMINYFQYTLPAPKQGAPVSLLTELSQAPWNKNHQLLRISLRAKDIPKENLPPANLVFLIDVSGSMYGHNRLPLVKSSLKLLVDQLRKEDRVAIVTYAGSATVKLNSTSGEEKMSIKQAIDELEARGATAGGAGLKLAYKLAKSSFLKNGNNRVIMASDGDFNVGDHSDKDMEELIESERKSGVHLTVLGFGMGNLKDHKMESLANKGHGNYAYIDHISEARKAIITEFGGTLYTVAKDVKMQVEFNPAYVQAYRLVGYENRLLEAEDFNDDTKLGGDMGVGHTVTAFYEVIPVGVVSNLIGTVDELKYQSKDNIKKTKARDNHELATVKFRYKEPKSEQSRAQEVVVNDEVKPMNIVSEDFRFASAVAEFGMLLRGSDFAQDANWDALLKRAQAAKGSDLDGYREEFIRLVRNSQLLMETNAVFPTER